MTLSPLAHLLACATCMPDRGSTVFMAQQSAIEFMLVLVFAMLGVLLLIIFNFARKARRAAAAQSERFSLFP